MHDDEAHARSDDPHSSHEAAEYMTLRLGAKQQEVYDWGAAQPDVWTLKDLTEAKRIEHPKASESTWRSRVSELRRKGLVEYAGYDRFDDSGKNHQLWRTVKRPV